VLVAFYKATAGDDWERTEGWSDRPLSECEGVTIDASGRVNQLELVKNNISGNRLIACSAASDVDMNTGNIPVELSRLSSLTTMVLRGNDLSGKSYDTIREVATANNCVYTIAGSIPSELSQLSSLIALVLSDNIISGK
jgi:hypothetical protein